MFNINQQCVLEKVMGDRGSNDESEPWVNLRFSFDNLSCEAAAAVLGCKGGAAAVRAAFFDEDGNNRFPGADTIPIGRRFENTHTINVSGGTKLRVDSLWGVKLTPYGKDVFSGEFKVTIKELPEGFFDDMINKCHRSVKVKLVQEQRELFDKETASPAEKTEDQQVLNLSERKRARDKKQLDEAEKALSE